MSLPISTIEPSLPHLARFDLPTAGGGKARPRRARSALRLLETAALVAFLGFVTLWLQAQLSAPGVSRLSGDFVSFWTAGQQALHGEAADAYDHFPHYAAEFALHDDIGWGFLSFFYPPFFLLLCAGLALLPYFPALCLWLGATWAGYAVALRALAARGAREAQRSWLLFLAYPAAIANAGFGQNGFLSAALFGGAAVWLDRRPVLAGICLGCLAYKPQLGLVLPLALIVAGRWRCFVAAAATVLVLCAAATVAFGPAIWPAFFAGMAEARSNWLEQDNNPFYLQYLITVFGAIRLHDGPLALAYAAQAAVMIAAIGLLVYALYRRPRVAGSGRADIAAIAACVPFCSPFLLEYDLVILAVPMLWLLGENARDGFRALDVGAIAAAYVAPLLFKLGGIEHSALKLVVMPAAALLFAAVLTRIISPVRLRADGTLPSRVA
jgi:alpha-1,2-mannosyltransferase